MAINNVRNEHPRPSFERKTWLNLNGDWDFEYDDNDLGLKSKWYQNKSFSKKIVVPYVFQSELSGINEQAVHDIVWYSRELNIPEELKNKRINLHFGAVDYKADVWVNGNHVITHEGGHVPFSVEITDLLKDSGNKLVVRVEDYTYDLELPRGKQYWKEKSEGIFYTRTTGIWQTVWLEAVSENYLKNTWITPDLDNKKVHVEYELDRGSSNTCLEVTITLRGKIIVQDRISIINGRGKRDFWLDQNITIDWNHQESWAWTPENPVLFDINFKVIVDDECIDEVTSYFGLRKVSIVSGKFMLNNRPYFQKMLLDQGYWEKSLLTAPSDEDFVKDIKLSKAMGFNGVRKHQKIEDPRYLYWADKLGFLVWGEIASAYNYSRIYVERITKEWMEMIKRDYNHPCIVAWTPLNESWGVEGIMNNKAEQAHSASMYWLTKSLDQTRPVISNDGWDHTKTDLLTIHDYEWKNEVLKDRYSSLDSIINSTPSGRTILAQGWEYEGQPIIVSEMGGISYQKSDWKGWGYSSASSDEDYIKRYYDVISPLLESPLVQGFVYTQITDVEQEINGLLTYKREPKVDVDIIKSINEGKWKPN
ncbi:glycoside hydrolase family 2 protein [Clostridium folliculivorans]|uniref:Beta-glucuronidase n=1 Tax=Clostridium folliculivorans TaxID=2886038 RepID=A0A9W6D8U8_9CLOT|nr:sugar-binding domain-containing protein [Clostridium folliculivorans]GKU23715.1 beta-glucuronidase [Clostridium folliculivorans]GKU29831.1 beta-glucuronidase [Clostridium folliculivorans]